MRPTLTEQLEGVHRVLTELVAPALTDPYLQEQVTHAAAALVHVAARWPHATADLVADIRALEELLGITPRQLEASRHGVVALAPAEEYHRELRARLVAVIMDAPEPSAAVRTYLQDSIERL